MENGVYTGPSDGEPNPGPVLYSDYSAHKHKALPLEKSDLFSRQVAANNGLDGVLTLVASTTVFFNECEVYFRFDWRSVADLPPDVNVQVYLGRFHFLHPVALSVYSMFYI